jgi:hypothetical protein
LAWRQLRDRKKTIEYFTKALRIFEGVYGKDHPSTKTVKSNLDYIKNLEWQSKVSRLKWYKKTGPVFFALTGPASFVKYF